MSLRPPLGPALLSILNGHASIAGNEIADALAKEGATEAMNQPEGRSSTTILETKEATKKTQISKWQSRWDYTNIPDARPKS